MKSYLHINGFMSTSIRVLKLISTRSAPAKNALTSYLETIFIKKVIEKFTFGPKKNRWEWDCETKQRKSYSRSYHQNQVIPWHARSEQSRSCMYLCMYVLQLKTMTKYQLDCSKQFKSEFLSLMRSCNLDVKFWLITKKISHSCWNRPIHA